MLLKGYFNDIFLRIRRFGKSDIFSYLSFGLIAKVIPFLASLVLVHLLLPAYYGVVSVFMSIMALSASFINFGVNQMVVRERQFLTEIEFSRLFSSSRLLSLVLLILVIPSIYLLFSCIPGWVIEFKWVLIALLLSWCLASLELIAKVFVVNRDAFAFGILDVLKLGLVSLLSICFILFYPDHGLEARISGIAVGLIFSALFGVYLLKKHITFQPPKLFEIKRIFVYGIKVLPQVFSNWMKMGADKVLLVSLVSLAELGAYSFTFTVCTVVMVFGNAIHNTFIEYSMRMYKGGKIAELRKKRRKNILISCLLYSSYALFIIGVSKLWWPEGYKVSDLSIVMIVLALFFQIVYLHFAKIFLYKENVGELGGVNLLFSFVYVLFLVNPVMEPSIEYAVLCFAGNNFCLTLYVTCRSFFIEKNEFRIDAV